MSPFEKHGYSFDLGHVGRFIYLVYAWRITSLDLILKTRPLTRGKVSVGAGAQVEMFVDEVERTPRAGG
jgi:hypothetical protein